LPDRVRPVKVMVVAACTEECAGCHNHAYARRPSGSVKGPVRPELPVVRPFAPDEPVNAPLYPEERSSINPTAVRPVQRAVS
jgi:hypothetical protein